MTPFTPLANMTGRPALCLPLHWTDASLPLGVQFVGAPAPGSEGLLIRLPAELGAARPWVGRFPSAFPHALPDTARRPVRAAL